MEYQEHIKVKAVDQILKVQYRKFKHQDGFLKSIITQILINNQFQLKYSLKMEEFNKERMIYKIKNLMGLRGN